MHDARAQALPPQHWPTHWRTLRALGGTEHVLEATRQRLLRNLRRRLWRLHRCYSARFALRHVIGHLPSRRDGGQWRARGAASATPGRKRTWVGRAPFSLCAGSDEKSSIDMAHVAKDRATSALYPQFIALPSRLLFSR
jgi:hypothetical protein